MKIYLDSCSLQRPLDDQTQLRIATETQIVTGVFILWKEGKFELLGSDALDYEARNIPDTDRKAFILEILKDLNPFIELNQEVKDKAVQYRNLGIKPLDAFHLSSAVIAKADYFCSCDDKFVKKAKNADTGTTIVVSILELLNYIE